VDDQILQYFYSKEFMPSIPAIHISIRDVDNKYNENNVYQLDKNSKIGEKDKKSRIQYIIVIPHS
jgi:hypothetical protein